MPIYVYENCSCPEQAGLGETFEANVPMESRDTFGCGFCGRLLKRKISFTGLTWAPTAGGMR